MMEFNNERVVITGAGGGLGQALVAGFAAAGALVVACDLPGSDLSQAGIAERHYFDMVDAAAVQQAGQDIVDAGAPSVFVSNAGWTRAETFEQLSAQALIDEMNCNFHGAATLSRALMPSMRNRDPGASMVFIASVNAVAHHGNPAYSAAKAAILAWVRAIAVEEGRNAIRANAVIPASIRTNAWDHRIAADPDILNRISALYPLGRIVSPQEVANAVLFLASARASGITGTTLNVDAGLLAGNLPFLDAIS